MLYTPDFVKFVLHIFSESNCQEAQIFPCFFINVLKNVNLDNAVPKFQTEIMGTYYELSDIAQNVNGTQPKGN